MALRPAGWVETLRSWPMLVAAVAAIAAGTWLLAGTESREALGTVLVCLGAVCLGAWIALLASHGYRGGPSAGD